MMSGVESRAHGTVTDVVMVVAVVVAAVVVVAALVVEGIVLIMVEYLVDVALGCVTEVTIDADVVVVVVEV